MSDSDKRHSAEAGPAAPTGSAANGSPAAPRAGPGSCGTGHQDLIADLKLPLEDSRLSPAQRQQILANLSSWEEQERLYREMQQTAGLTFEQFLESLGLEDEP